MFDWVTIQKAAQESGYSVPALRSKIARGQLVEQIHWKKNVDGRILIHIQHFSDWLKQ